MSGFRGMHVTVVGLASSGVAAARVLAAEGARVRVTEQRSLADVRDAASEVEAAGAEVLAGGHAPEHLHGADLVVTSPGVPEGADVLRWAAERGIPVWSELEVGARLARCPYVAVTGTNGKTTTTEMVAAAMREAGLDAIACGNVGYPFSVAATEGHDALAVEASSFQLRFHETFHPRVSAILNVAEDHLDWHPGPEAYRAAKARIYARQSQDDVHVGNRDDAVGAALSERATCRRVWFTERAPRPGEVGFRGDELVSLLDDEVSLGRPAVIQRANAAAAAALGLSFGLEPEAIGDALRTFRPLPHRGETVAVVEGVRFVDDSKATNPHAALATIRGFPGAVLICGGRSKGVDLSPLAEAAPHLEAVVVLGEAADELAALFEGRIKVLRAVSIEEAVRSAFGVARPDGTVLLAPACSSWDMFRDYAERGERFASAARALEREVVGG